MLLNQGISLVCQGKLDSIVVNYKKSRLTCAADQPATPQTPPVA